MFNWLFFVILFYIEGETSYGKLSYNPPLEVQVVWQNSSVLML